MITKEELQKRLRESLLSIEQGDLQLVNKKIMDVLKFAVENYDNLASDAKKLTDRLTETCQDFAAEVLEKLPEGKEKRMLKRLHAGSLGERFLVEAAIKTLEGRPELKKDSSKEFRRIFIARLQNLTDFMYDVHQNTVSGAIAFGQISLFGMCIDELLVTLHLTQHSYINQAYSHIRTALEHLDKIELFRIKPKWVELWCSNDRKRMREELSPAKVRKKLGKPKYDPLYSFFSELGPHGTFKAVQTKTFRKAKLSLKGNPQILQWLGGCPVEHHVLFLEGYALYTIHLLLIQLVKCFEQFLNQEEIDEVLTESRNDTLEYFKRYVLPWAKRSNLNVTDLENLLKSWSGVKTE